LAGVAENIAIACLRKTFPWP